MNDELKRRLEAEDQDEELTKLRERVVSDVKRSRSSMAKKYSTWDKHHETYLGIRTPDEDDLKARDANEPEKMVVPMCFAQVQTFVAFCFLLFKQNGKLFELLASGSEDEDYRACGESLLECDQRYNNFDVQLVQLLTDVARFNIGVRKTSWHKETMWVETKPQPVLQIADGGFDQMLTPSPVWVEATLFEGNLIQSVSPYNFFPDPAYSLADWRRGKFAADESEWHVSALKKRERAGGVAGVEHINPMDQARFTERGTTRLEGVEKALNSRNQDRDDHMVCVTEWHGEIIPKDYGFSEHEHPVKYVVEVANDDRVIRAEPEGYLHGRSVYDLALFSPDQHQLVGDCLTDTISALQETVSFLFNSRIASVRRSLDNQLVVDPSGVDMASVESRSPWITMKKGSPRLGVDKFIRQLNYTDTTARHLDDASAVMQIMQAVTGVNENAMGQFHGGRRSATEARAVNAGAASRMKVVATMIWSSMLAPMGAKMLSNHRQGLSEERFAKVLGENKRAMFAQFKPTDPLALVGAEDFFVFDSTLQSEKGFIAQSLQELVTAMMSNPLVMQMLNMDVPKIIKEIMALRGVQNLERFQLPPQLPYGQPPLGPALPGPLGAGSPQMPSGTPQLQRVAPGLPVSA